MFLGVTIDAWNILTQIFLGATAFAAIGLFVAQRAVIVLQDEAEKRAKSDLEKYKSDASERLDKAVKEADQKIAEANERTEKAHERSAQLEKESAFAKLEQERLKQIVSWRSLSVESGNALAKALRGKNVCVKLAYVSGDPEALGLAIQFSKVLDAAQWKVLPESMTFPTSLVFDIHLPGPENDTVRLLRSAFAGAGIQFSTEDIPAASMSFTQSGPEKPCAMVFIGSKRPPF